MIDKDKLMERLQELRDARLLLEPEANAPWQDAIADLMDEVEGWCAPHRKLEAHSWPVELFYELRQRAKDQGLTIGLYLYRTYALPPENEIGTLRMRLTGKPDETLTESLTTIRKEIEWYENRSSSEAG